MKINPTISGNIANAWTLVSDNEVNADMYRGSMKNRASNDSGMVEHGHF